MNSLGYNCFSITYFSRFKNEIPVGTVSWKLYFAPELSYPIELAGYLWKTKSKAQVIKLRLTRLLVQF